MPCPARGGDEEEVEEKEEARAAGEAAAEEEEWHCNVVKATRRDQRCDGCGALAEGRKSFW
eukprot:5568677-Lingulodinium_polyedra.AAC.1